MRGLLACCSSRPLPTLPKNWRQLHAGRCLLTQYHLGIQAGGRQDEGGKSLREKGGNLPTGRDCCAATHTEQRSHAGSVGLRSAGIHSLQEVCWLPCRRMDLWRRWPLAGRCGECNVGGGNGGANRDWRLTASPFLFLFRVFPVRLVDDSPARVVARLPTDASVSSYVAERARVDSEEAASDHFVTRLPDQDGAFFICLTDLFALAAYGAPADKGSVREQELLAFLLYLSRMPVFAQRSSKLSAACHVLVLRCCPFGVPSKMFVDRGIGRSDSRGGGSAEVALLQHLPTSPGTAAKGLLSRSRPSLVFDVCDVYNMVHYSDLSAPSVTTVAGRLSVECVDISESRSDVTVACKVPMAIRSLSFHSAVQISDSARPSQICFAIAGSSSTVVVPLTEFMCVDNGKLLRDAFPLECSVVHELLSVPSASSSGPLPGAATSAATLTAIASATTTAAAAARARVRIEVRMPSTAKIESNVAFDSLSVSVSLPRYGGTISSFANTTAQTVGQVAGAPAGSAAASQVRIGQPAAFEMFCQFQGKLSLKKLSLSCSFELAVDSVVPEAWSLPLRCLLQFRVPSFSLSGLEIKANAVQIFPAIDNLQVSVRREMVSGKVLVWSKPLHFSEDKIA